MRCLNSFLSILLVVLCIACSNNAPIQQENVPNADSASKVNTDGAKKVHFTFDYADDILKNALFDTSKKRDAYKSKALDDMERMFNDFYNRFQFQPEHQIHITLSEYVNGGKNSAYTTKTFDGAGRITKLSMHFPYEMFDKKSVRAHELTHAFVAPFMLPTWVDEGFAVLNENLYTDTPRHAVFNSFEEDLRKDHNGINAVQHWTEGTGIYSDYDLTIWCYRYSHTIVNYIEKTYPGTFSKLFDHLTPKSVMAKSEPTTKLSTGVFINIIDVYIDADMVKFFKSINFEY